MHKQLTLAIAVSLSLLLCLSPRAGLAEGDDDFTVIEDQSFDAELDGFGPVRFVSLTDLMSCRFELWRDGEPIYTLPESYADNWACYDVEAVAFRDFNADGVNDIGVVATAITGIGPTAAIPFHANTIYYNDGEGAFFTKLEVNEFISEYETLGELSKALSKSPFATVAPGGE